MANKFMFVKLKKLKNFLGPEVVRYLILSVVIGVAWFLVESSFLFVIQGFFLAIGLLEESKVMLPSWYPRSLAAAVTFLILFGFFRSLTMVLKNHVSFLSQISFTTSQRKKVISLGLKNAQAVSTKEVIAIFSEIISQSGTVVSNLAMAVNVLCAIVLFFIAGLKLAPSEMLIGVFFLGIFLFPLKFVSRHINSYGNKLVAEWERLNGSLIGGLKNYFFLAIYNQIDAEVKRGASGIQGYRDSYSKYSIVSNSAGAFPSLTGVIIISVITYFGVKYFQTPAVTLISFFYLFIRLSQSAGEASRVFANLKLNMPSLKKLYYWTEKISSIPKDHRVVKEVVESGSVAVEARDVSFSFDGKEKLFSNLNFSIRESDVLVIKGESGAGKSTLLSLVLGLNLPSSGDIVINSNSTTETQVDLHKVMAYVGPEPYLINDSVRENLLYGLPRSSSVSDEDLWGALEKVELKTLVEGLEDQLDELVYDIPQLSYGQRQRLAFARALVRKPSLLILDEATSNLDSATESKIMKNLGPLFEQSTSVIVTHKDSFDSLASKTIHLGKRMVHV